MTTGIGYAQRTNEQRDIQPVAIIAVDPITRKAKALTRISTEIEVDCRVPVGGVYVIPDVGDQWYVDRYDMVWHLQSRIPFNDNNILIEPKPGQMVMGGTGPVEMNGSELNVHGPTNVNGPLTVGDVLLQDIDGTLQQSTDGGETFSPIAGAGEITDITGLTEALASKIDKPVTPITPGTHTKITYDSNGLVIDGDDAEIIDITGLQDALANKSDVSHTHVGSGGPALPLTTKGDLLTWITDLVRKPVGDDGTWLKADSAQPDGLLWDLLAIADVMGLQDELDAKQDAGGLLLPGQIPGLDCSKIISGVFGSGFIPGLDASKIISGEFLTGLIPGLDANKIISGSFLTSLIPGLDATKIISGAFGSGQIPGLDASKIISGLFGSTQIPGLDASKIISGIFGSSQIPTLNNLLGTLTSPQIPGLDASKIISGQFPQSMLDILNIPATIVSGVLGGAQIPGLDASKIISGSFLTSLIPGLDASKIISGAFGLPQIPLLDLTKIPNLPASQVTSGTFLAGLIPALDASKITSGQFPQSMLNITSIAAGIVTGILSGSQIPGLDASKIISGIFDPGSIPALDASQITSGQFLTDLIPSLDTSWITSGQFPQSMLDITNIPAGIVSGILSALQIPTLDATKIGSGTFLTSLIPNLDAAKITSGTLLQSLIPLLSTGQIPNLDAGKITSGVLNLLQIPGLPTSRITSGTFPQSMLDITSIAAGIISGTLSTGQIPNLDANKITTGILDLLRIPGLDATRIPLLDASKIATGILGLAQIPGLDLTKIPNLPASQITSGIFGTGLIPGLDVSKIISGVFPIPRIPALDATQITSGTFPQNMIANLPANLSSIFTTITSPVASNLLQNVPISAIGQFNPELLTNPNYDSLGSVAGGSTSWTWDPAVSHTAGGTGSARFTANGTTGQLLSDPPIPVSPNQVLSISHWLQWSGVTATPGIAFRLSVVAYLGIGISNTVDLQTISNPAASSGWIQLSGQYTVPATGVDNIRLQLTVTSQVTVGNIWWDDGSVKKTQLLNEAWTAGLPGDLNNLLSGINARALITDLTGLQSTLGLGDPSLTAITNRLANLGAGGKFDAGSLLNLIPMSLIPLLTVGKIPALDATQITSGAFAQAMVSGLPAALQSGLDFTQTLQDTIVQTFTNTSTTNTLLADFTQALNAIPFANILGLGGPPSIGGSMQGTWDNLISGLVGTLGSGAGLADLFNVAFQVSSSAAKGSDSWDILGIRNNKPLDTGLMSTSASNYGLSKIALGGSAPTFPLTQSTATIGFHRIDEAGTKGVVSWLGSGVANITDFRVNIWKMDPVTGAMTLVHNSANAIGAVGGTMGWNIYTLPTPLAVDAGEVYGVELAVVGSGTHSVAGQSTWLPNHPTVYPRNLAAVRNSGGGAPPSSIASGSVNYATNVPWIEFGVNQGGTPIPRSPVTTFFGTVGTTTIPIPDWANFVDVIGVGAGAGGGGGGSFGIAQHNGGGAGQWVTGTWTRTTDFSSGTIISVTIGAGGPNGGSLAGGQGPGGSTVVSVPGRTRTGTGGAINWGQDNGQGAGNVGYRGITYVGGAQQGSNGSAGAAPGGGGASGPDIYGGPGGDGAKGGAWIVFRQT